MKDGTITGVLRGEDSTGMMQYLSRPNTYDVAKSPYEGSMFAKTRRAQAMYCHADEPGFTVLHHRAATRGSVSPENAHPFEHREGEKVIVGVHNGTLHSAHTNYDKKRFDVDSDFMLYKMMKEGASKALGDVRGAIATIWWEGDKTLKLFCNGERSLFFAFVRNKNVMLIASEAGMLYWLASRNNLEIEKVEGVGESILVPEKNAIITFDLEGELREFKTEAVEVASSTNFSQGYRLYDWAPVEPKTRTPVTNTASTNGTLITPIHKELSNAGKDKFIEEVGLAIGDKVNFYPDSVYHTHTTRITGWTECNNDYLPAVMYQVTPAVAEAINNAESAEVVIKGSTVLRMPNKDGKEEETKGLIVSIPTSVIMKGDKKEIEDVSLIELDDLDELPDVPESKSEVEFLIPGPNGRLLPMAKFLQMTSDGCMQCGTILFPAMARDKLLTWVNNDTNAICHDCANDTKKALGVK